MNIIGYFLLGAIALCLFGVDRSQAASADIIEGAKKEREINWYGGGSSEIDEDINRGFMKKYPFIQAKKFRIQSQRLLVRFETESRAGKHSADIVRTTDWYIDIFKKKNLLLKYDSPERKQIPDELKDRDGFYTALYMFLHVTAYNTKLVPKSELPHSYDDLLNPKWKDKLGLEDAAYVWFVNLIKIKGEKQGIEYMRRLARQNVSLRSGTTLLSSLVAAGELPMAIDLYAYNVERVKKAGAPLDWVALEPAIVHTVTAGINRNAPHPNASKLFMDFLLSEEGQRIYLGENMQPARRGLAPAWVPRNLKLLVNDPDIGDKVGDYQKLFAEIFGAN
ncbi:MAG TPA: extracellular solute-binding protein [Candidatus Limnocylindrales bacterium]|nr:extracellular solute-binding protein [Candidatus Limnocylindrales bacterium]